MWPPVLRDLHCTPVAAIAAAIVIAAATAIVVVAAAAVAAVAAVYKSRKIVNRQECFRPI